MKLHTLAAALAGALLFTLSGPAKAVPLLVLENDRLLGADNVDVNGTLFDVRFRDGTCGAVFTGCDNASEDFAFTDAASAEAAAQVSSTPAVSRSQASSPSPRVGAST